MDFMSDDECDEIIDAAIAADAATHLIKNNDLVTDIRQRPALGREIVRRAALKCLAGASADQSIARGARRIVAELQDSPKSALSTLSSIVQKVDASN